MIVYTMITLFCCFLYGLSAILCKYGLQNNVNMTTFSVKKGISFLSKNKIWITGVLLGGLSNLIIIEMQAHLDISIVYSILSFSYVFVLILGHYILGEKLNDNQWSGVFSVIIGTILILTIRDLRTGKATDVGNLITLTAILVGTLCSIIIVTFKSKRFDYEIPFAVCTGICFSCVEIYLKSGTNLVAEQLGYFTILSQQSLMRFVMVWPFYIMFLFGALGWLCLQITYSRGKVSITVPVIVATQRIVSMSSGYFVFSESFSMMRILGICAIVFGVFVLILATIDLQKKETI